MSASMEWQGGGLEALAKEFETLPDQLLNDVIDPVMEAQTSEAVQRMQTRYGFDSLSKGVQREKAGPGDYWIKNTAPHAHLFELGTAARFHADGSPTGVMPAKPVLIPESVAARERIGRGVSEDFTKLRTAHLEVTR